MTSTKIGRLFSLAFTKPLSTTGAPLPGARMYFFTSGAYTTQQTVYADALLQTPLSQPVTADASGRFPPVFLNPALLYSWQLYSSGSILLEQADPVNAQNTAIPASMVVAADTSRASTTALAADPYLTYAIPTAGTYAVVLDLSVYTSSDGATPGIKYQINFSGSVNASAGNAFAATGAMDGGSLTITQSAFSLDGTIAAPLSATLNNMMRIAGTIQVISPGTLALLWAQNVSSANATTVLQGSSMTVTRLG
jgi:hypothetical protein